MLFHTTAAHIEEILAESRSKIILLDFYASWCAPCRALAPILDKLTDRHELHLTGYSVNADTDPELLEQFDVSVLPTVVLIRDGEVTGMLDKDITEEALDAAIGQCLG